MACCIGSEIIARTRNRKITPSNTTVVNESSARNLVISNLIPFANLNRIFFFILFFNAFIRVIRLTEIGVPYLSVNSVIMLLCLLFFNPEAKNHFKRKSVVFRWLNSLVTRC